MDKVRPPVTTATKDIDIKMIEGTKHSSLQAKDANFNIPEQANTSPESNLNPETTQPITVEDLRQMEPIYQKQEQVSIPNLDNVEDPNQAQQTIMGFLSQGGDVQKLTEAYPEGLVFNQLQEIQQQQKQTIDDLAWIRKETEPDTYLEKAENGVLKFLSLGGSKKELEKLAELSPEVAEILTNIKAGEALLTATEQTEGVQSQIKPEQLEKVQQEVENQAESLIDTTITTTNGEKKKITTTEKTIFLVLLTADVFLFNSQGLSKALDSVVDQFAKKTFNGYLRDLGFDIPEYTENGFLFNKMMEAMDSKGFNELLKKMTESPEGETEIINILKSMTQQDRLKLLGGESFGGFLGSKHKVDAELLPAVQQVAQKHAGELEVEKFFAEVQTA